jgi:small subunit ribosomal protein S1
VVAPEYQEAFGEHAYDEAGNYIGGDYQAAGFTPETEAQAAWADYAAGPGDEAQAGEAQAGEEPGAEEPGAEEPAVGADELAATGPTARGEDLSSEQ